MYEIWLRQLEKKYQVKQAGEGIYRIDGMLFPMQVIVTRELETDRHIWLKSLTRNIDIVQAEELLDSFDRLEAEETRAKAAVVVNLVSDLNSGVFEQIVNGGGRIYGYLSDIVGEMETGDELYPGLKELLADKIAELADKDAEIADKNAEIADRDAELADKDAKLADKDAELAALKCILAEKERQRWKH